MNSDEKARYEAMKALAVVAGDDSRKMEERAIKGYIERLEVQLNKMTADRDNEKRIGDSYADCIDEIQELVGRFQDHTYSSVKELVGDFNTLQALHPSEFKALWNAKCLPNSGIHNGAYRAPGGADDDTLRTLVERGWLQTNPERRGFYILTHAGKQLIGELKEGDL